jgi:hypothetical protein
MLAKINTFLNRHKQELYLVLVMALVAVLAFGLGRLSVYYGTEGEFQVIYPEAGKAE